MNEGQKDSYPDDSLNPRGYVNPPSGDFRQAPRRGRTGLFVLVGILLLSFIIGAGILVDVVVFQRGKSSPKEFSLEDSISYGEALNDMRRFYFREYSEEKVKEAAQKAVAEAKKKGESSPSALEDAGITAAAKALGDPYSTYYNAIENKRLKEDLSGSFYGVGIELRVDKELKRPKVYDVLKGSPAERVGIKRNDVIMEVDGKKTKGIGLEIIVSWIRGREGTKVEITVQREGVSRELKFKMKREKITTPDFKSEILDGKYGLLQVMDFNKGIGQKVRDAVAEMQEKGVVGFILDLRDNHGGLLNESVNLSSVFLDQGLPVVSFQFKGEKKSVLHAFGGKATDLPVVLLVNGMSASASEIVAGALKEHKRAILIGTKTYGKGSIQKMYDLENGGALRLTVSIYYLPNGDEINGKGVEPDIPVALEDKPEEERKLQLDRAKHVLENMIQGKPPEASLFMHAA